MTAKQKFKSAIRSLELNFRESHGMSLEDLREWRILRLGEKIQVKDQSWLVNSKSWFEVDFILAGGEVKEFHSPFRRKFRRSEEDSSYRYLDAGELTQPEDQFLEAMNNCFRLAQF
jgi:hypothetical protein